MKYPATELFLIILVLFTLPLNTSWNEETVSDENQMNPVLIQFKTAPLNINTASFSDLQLLPWLSEVQIKDIISYRTTRLIKGRKQLIRLGIDEFTLDEMEDYIVFSPKPEISFLSVVRGELKRSELEHSSCLKFYSKHIFSRGRLEAGFITQKDEMESNLLDFYSYYIQLKDQGPLEKIIVGKYQLYYGLGILMQSKLGSGKNINAAGNLLRIRTTIAPYRSAYESWALEGCSAQLKFGFLKFIPFFSQSALSANLESGKITSFNETGLNYDLKEKNNVRESIWGLFTELEWKNHSMNFGMLQQKFDHSFADEEKKSRTRSIGFCLELWKNLFPLKTELVWSNGCTGILSSFSFVTKSIRQQVIFRKYAKDLPAWHGNPFSARSNFPNEEGFYYGITASSFAGLKLNFYMDIWRLPETSYLEKMPVTGNEIMLKCSCEAS